VRYAAPDGISCAFQAPAPPVVWAHFAAASATTAVVGFQRLYRTVDGGTRWAPVGPAGLTWSYLGFTDPTHGVALGYLGPESPNHARLYYTTDGGASYHELPIR
jgi:photosystem II stability/assembly factor-like uncharacterized protein